MEFGTVVIFTEFGKSFPALVVGSRELEHHGGENEEPLLNLVFVSEVKDGTGNVSKVTGTIREGELIQFRHDVAHDSHAFTPAAVKDLTDKGLLPPGGAVPGGRWSEAMVIPAGAEPANDGPALQGSNATVQPSAADLDAVAADDAAKAQTSAKPDEPKAGEPPVDPKPPETIQ